MTNQINSVVVVGGGHNGLVCATYLAKAGKKVTVLEAAKQVGGACVTREFAPDFRVSAGAHLSYLLDADIRKELGLDSHGLSMAAEKIGSVALSPNGQHLYFEGENVSGEGLNERDLQGMKEYRRFMAKFAGIIGKLHNRIPPRVGTKDRGDLIDLGKLALEIRLMGTDDMREFLRIAAINIYDVLQENFDNELLKGALALDAVLGTKSAPRSNNSVFTALHRMSGNNGHGAGVLSIPRGGMGAIADALAAAAKKAGADIRTNSPVKRILMDFDKVSGVELENGEQILADIVVSNADPKTTFLDLLGARNIEAGLAHRIKHLRSKGNTAKLHLALSDLPHFKGLDASKLGQRLLIAPSQEYVDHAFNHCKYGEFSAEPVFEITIPSIHDSSLAPPGQHVLSAVVQYAPRDLKEGWNSGKAAFTEVVLNTLEQYAPNIRSKAVVAELLTPEDIEQQFRIHGGHWHHAEMAMDQFFMLRPVPYAAQYHTPVNGLYLCGAGSHPGGGVMGSAGRNAARAIIGK
ncbi:MAG: NAD(P)/FAD-dependent oxidoreductase [Xanthomonadales bacterium]|nr:NAD(P)/FAD-dependent oxidoreductase [Xanthomonadales bacterium]